MRARSIMGFVLLMVATMAAAEPPKASQARPALPQPAKIVLASAEPVRTPTPAKAAAAPAKRPMGRVTTCRCGNPVPDQESQEQ